MIEEHITHIITCIITCVLSRFEGLAPRSPRACLRLSEKRQKIMPVMQAQGRIQDLF